MDHSSGLPLLLVYLDRYHLGDPLFLQRFALVVKAHEGPLVVLHGTGEAAERALEAGGRLVGRVEGVLHVEGEGERALVERAARELNRQIVHALNEAGVAAFRVSGTDRGLLRETARGEVAAGRVGWLVPLARRGAVPVIALLAERAGEAVEVSPGRAAAALAGGFATEGGGTPPVVFLAKEGSRREGAGAEALLQAVAEPETARRVAAAGIRTRVVRLATLRGEGLPTGADFPGDGA